MPAPTDPELLVGFESSDDAAVYRLTEGLAVVTSVDFITPPVDDPIWFGRIGAANALSDIYAMGARPVTALNLVMFPGEKLGTEVLREILKGGHEKVTEAGASLAGGHSVENPEPGYGLAVTGVVDPKRILTNRGARPGDVLILTKALGTGVLFNACRSKKLPRRELDPILPQVAALNRTTLEVAQAFEVHACTDITGFGLAGHTLEMARGSGVRIDIEFTALPFYDNARAMYQKGESTGSNAANRQLAQGWLEIQAALSKAEEELLFDPQTSGGLLLAVPATQGGRLVENLRHAQVQARLVGQVHQSLKPLLRVV